MVIAALLSLILGLLSGFYGRTVHDRLNSIYAELRERKEAKNVGVVRPIGIPATRNQPIDLSTETGGIRKPTPMELEELRQVERARVLRENHS